MRERDAIDLVACLLDPDGWVTVLDIGAGNGDASRRIVRSFPRASVHAFERTPHAFESLQSSTARQPRVFSWNLSVSGRSATSPSDSSSGATVATMTAAAATTIDDWMTQHRVARVDFLNINPGVDPLPVLKGAAGLLRRGGLRAIKLHADAVTESVSEYLRSNQMCPFPAGAERVGDGEPAAAGLWMHTSMLEALRIEPARAYRLDWRRALKAAINECLTAGARRIAIYGAGHHTLSCEEVIRTSAGIVALIDDNRGRVGQTTLDLPVLVLSEALDAQLDAVVISSNTQEQTIWEKTQCFRDAGIPVIRLYPEPITGVRPRPIPPVTAAAPGGAIATPGTTPGTAHAATKAATAALRAPEKALRDSLFRPVVFSEYEKLFLQRLAALGYRPNCVFDIGAASGWWSSIMSEVFPDAAYELFEPLLGNNPLYDGDLATILPRHPRFRAHATALGETNTQAEFWRDPGEGYGSSLLCEKMKESQRIVVPVARLDDYVATHNLAQPQIIKVDVQGGEAQVIEGGKKAFAGADILHLETWLERCYGPRTPLLHELIEILTPLNFRLVQLGGFWRHDRQTLSSVDAFFANINFIERLTAHGAGYPWPANGEY